MRRALTMIPGSLVFSFVLVVEAGCVADPPTTQRILPSGRVLEVVHAGLIDGDSASWVLEYRTHLPMTDRRALQCEVVALWPEFRDEATSSGASGAQVWPTTFDRQLKFDGWRPVLLSHHSTAFTFGRDDAGAFVAKGGWSGSDCLP